jgi:ankyrin repeat protein
MLQSDVDFKQATDRGLTIFHYAFENEVISDDVIIYLLNHIPDQYINKQDLDSNTPLTNLLAFRLRKSSIQVFDLLLAMQVNWDQLDTYGMTPVMIATERYYHTEPCNHFMKRLLDKPLSGDPADLNRNTLLMHALKNSRLPTKFVLKIFNLKPLPYLNIRNNMDETSFTLLLDAMGRSSSIRRKLAPIFEKMINAPEPPNFNTRYALAETPLMRCIKYGFPDDYIIIALNATNARYIDIQSGIENNGMNALMFAIIYEASSYIVQTLFDETEDRNRRDIDGNTALMLALKHHDNIDTSTLIHMIRRSDVRKTNNDGAYALEYAIHFIEQPRVNEIVEALLNRDDFVSDRARSLVRHNNFLDVSLITTSPSRTPIPTLSSESF